MIIPENLFMTRRGILVDMNQCQVCEVNRAGKCEAMHPSGTWAALGNTILKPCRAIKLVPLSVANEVGI